MTEEEYASALVEFIGEEFLQGEAQAGLDSSTPLMESGILDSLRIALLLTYIRDELGLSVPPGKIDAEHFKDVRTIASMLREIAQDEDATAVERA